ncbi:MAG: hypothetical protein K1X79_07560 [Oligoflexia bacterium]|nr:hypothetical protein [Oligoflexia bacterium]
MLRSGSFNFKKSYQQRRLLRSMLAMLVLTFVVGLYVNALIIERPKPTLDELRALVDEHFQDRLVQLRTELRFDAQGELLITEMIQLSTAGKVYKHGMQRAVPVSVDSEAGESYPLEVDVLRRQIEQQRREIGGLKFDPPHIADKFIYIPIADKSFELKPGLYMMTLQYKVRGLRELVRKTGTIHWGLSGAWDTAIESCIAQIIFPANLPDQTLRLSARLEHSPQVEWTSDPRGSTQELPFIKVKSSELGKGNGYQLAYPAPIFPAERLVADIRMPPDIFE